MRKAFGLHVGSSPHSGQRTGVIPKLKEWLEKLDQEYNETDDDSDEEVDIEQANDSTDGDDFHLWKDKPKTFLDCHRPLKQKLGIKLVKQITLYKPEELMKKISCTDAMARSLVLEAEMICGIKKNTK
jgi:hypothetical protein